MVTTATNDEFATGTSRDVSSATATTCACGQQLDCCTREHCPRCGRAISHR